MTRHRIDLAVFFVLATAIGGAVLAAIPSDRTIIFHSYILVVGGLLLVGVIAEIRDAFPRRHRSELIRALDAPREETHTLPELAKLEREVTLSVGNAFTFHTRLLPQLREIAEARLERAGRRPGPETLGSWWELLRPDRPVPADHLATGIPESELRQLVAELERM
jgi:hypothetical protein